MTPKSRPTATVHECAVMLFPIAARAGHVRRLARDLAALPEPDRGRRWVVEQNRLRGELVYAGIRDRDTIKRTLDELHRLIVDEMRYGAPGPQGPARAPQTPRPKKRKPDPALAALFARVERLLRGAPEPDVGKPAQLDLFEADR
ncbi:MAG: hypothetical protein KDJ74_04680 [Notoacmeibacter sp.]|nr:hypothetical protein [Notoacmeibacter sp.]